MAKSVALLLFGALLSPSVLSDCKCHHPEKNDTTRQGANQFVIYVEKKPYRGLEGTVQMYDDRTIENALVEVFDHPDYLLDENSLGNHPDQKRLAACRTAADGKFCFRTLPSGKYELRSSLDGGWNITHIYVVVDKKAGQTKKIEVVMSLGT
jgi:hypothetical protein